MENIILTNIANKKYKYLNDSKITPLNDKIKKDIFKKIKALFIHKIGSFVVFGTDNIIISKYLGLIQVGLYANYNLIISSLSTISSQIISSTTASVGNMLVNDSHEKQFDIFSKLRFINYWVTCFFCVGILIVIEPFITLWIGKEFLLSISTLIILVVNFYLNTTRSTYNAFKDAAGIYHEDRFIPLLESVLNITISIILVQIIGLTGVFIGTAISGLVLWLYSYPKLVYKKLFKRNYFNYAKETIGYFVLFIFICTLSLIISKITVIDSIYFEFIKNILLTIFIPNTIIIIIFRKTEELNYLKKFILKILMRTKKK